MQVLSQELLQKYQNTGAAYEIFHSYHPLEDANNKLVYKKTVPDNLKQHVEKPVQQPNNPQNNNGTPATDQTPQNENSYAYGNGTQQPNANDHGSHSSFVKIPPSKTTQESSVQNTRTNQVPTEYDSQNSTANTNDQPQSHTFTMPNLNENTTTDQTDPNFQEDNTVPPETTVNEQPQHFRANNYQAQPTNEQPDYPVKTEQTQASPSVSPNRQLPNQDRQIDTRPHSVLAKEVAKSNRINTINDENAELYEQIAHVSQELDWIHKVNSFELAYKKDLRNLPIPALRVFNIENSEEMILPFNDGSLLHDVSSITITRDMVIMLLFRNNTPLKLVPEGWYNNGNNRDILIKNGFNYFYKSVDAKQLKETLKLLSVNYSSTPEFTQFILKTMPFVPIQSN
ncbi:MAG: hypothetical protein N4R48_03405 [Lactobacillus crispatus]|jgi:hypothetical protein|uniref:Uncharacterized protein n=1 Tax=Lactobacillus crispatus TaxID=47770 RepID=A0A4V3BI31_9LACO|nr:hypothetical protein [Lactobacillus crispatus]MBI1711014.1 hypothetical protein [Lactobacillus crispatus]MCT7776256.1 hypothetical protein [Lactobacillus crispatus]MCT7820416.1 hypothetical protein [Lactobacillus crispatus]MDX5113243.1 hypothetical protein [Lactobacillus crispatus]MDX5120399.1 hypothetical protein [Lactobacillus crispatus]